jgi:hypothetical protein
MAKAYDRVAWDYLYSMMRGLGFSEAWSSLIMKCVSSVSFSVCVNGVFSESFKLTQTEKLLSCAAREVLLKSVV